MSTKYYFYEAFTKSVNGFNRILKISKLFGIGSVAGVGAGAGAELDEVWFGNFLLITHKFAKSYPKASSPSSALAVILLLVRRR